MSVVSKRIDRPIEDVFAALVTPVTYPSWLVGCKEIRAVDDGWPAVGTRFHHCVGVAGPVTVADSSRVEAIEAPHRLVLEVRARPVGRGQVTFTLEQQAPGSSTTLTVDEVPVGRLAVLRPLLAPLVMARNERSLTRLEEHLTPAETHPGTRAGTHVKATPEGS